MNWTTDINISQGENGWFHVSAHCIWRTAETCQAEMDRVLHAFADGRRAFIRRAPWVEIVNDFETTTTFHTGGVRLAFKTEPGEWEYPQPIEEGATFGLARLHDVPPNETVL